MPQTLLKSQQAFGGDGWQPANETWTRTGDHTFTVSGDVVTKYPVGTVVKYYDGATDYGVVASSSYGSPNTTVTLITNTSYAMAATTITNNYYSYGSPPGFAGVSFIYTVTPTGFSGSPTVSGKFQTIRRMLFLQISCSGTSNATTFTLSLPVTVSYGGNMLLRTMDNGAWVSGGGLVSLSGTTMTIYKDAPANAFTNSGTKQLDTSLVVYGF